MVGFNKLIIASFIFSRGVNFSLPIDLCWGSEVINSVSLNDNEWRENLYAFIAHAADKMFAACELNPGALLMWSRPGIPLSWENCMDLALYWVDEMISKPLVVKVAVVTCF